MFHSLLTRCIQYILVPINALYSSKRPWYRSWILGASFVTYEHSRYRQSEHLFVSESCARRLGLHVLMKITDNLPNSSLPRELKNEFRGLNLADVLFDESRSVDLLIAGCELKKWASNNAGLLFDITRDHLEKPHVFDNTSGFSYIKNLESIKIGRYYLLNGILHGSLHGFADASAEWYGVAAYLRVVDCSGRVNLSLVMAKSRVAPIKSESTIPKLELYGAALVIKILDNVLYSIQNNVEIHDIVCWSDSTIVLSW
ncbi:hypothetical protein EVAR_77071_1 [Eumeta japonica]|uniref:Uncharacterized protein n=1 Tax=Eumeta variegata TaxID=151549 RepID=A0A4C1ZX57_EUMVA|nr:hypothetical protein EVAR_77071_1 [Eumeta japonica]